MKGAEQDYNVSDRLLGDSVVASFNIVEHGRVGREVEGNIVSESTLRPTWHLSAISLRDQFLVSYFDVLLADPVIARLATAGPHIRHIVSVNDAKDKRILRVQIF